jgi:ZIP family zinc transporter
MVPEAFESAHDFAGLITVAGFLAAFVLTKVGWANQQVRSACRHR